MTLSTTFARLKAAFSGALVAAAFSFSGAAMAQEPPKPDFFVGAYQDDAKAILVYVFSDSKKAAMEELVSAAVFPVPGYKPEGPKFDPAKGCKIARNFSIKQIPKKFKVQIADKPAYGPNSGQKPVNAFDFPSYMAREGTKFLLANKFITKEEEAVPHFNCAGYLWALISRPNEKDFWGKYLQEKYEELGKELDKQ